MDEQRRDEERAPVEEAGSGEAEGFEQAEEQLRAAAEHDDPGRSPERDEFPPEEESDRATSEYGDADDLDPDD
jgi:hypothetical protein